MPKVICNKHKDCENNDWCYHARPHNYGKNNNCSHIIEQYCQGFCCEESYLRYIRSNKINKINENTEESI